MTFLSGVPGKGEVRQLAVRFNQMTLRIKDLVDGLEYRVAELRMVQDQLQGMVRSKDEFLGSVSHELRTPLTSVVGYAALIRDSAERFDQAEIDEMVRLITAETTDTRTTRASSLSCSRRTIQRKPPRRHRRLRTR